jgi:hypothetical protein
VLEKVLSRKKLGSYALYISNPYPVQYSCNHLNGRVSKSGGSPLDVIKFDITVIRPGHKQLLANNDIFNSSMQMT